MSSLVGEIALRQRSIAICGSETGEADGEQSLDEKPLEAGTEHQCLSGPFDRRKFSPLPAVSSPIRDETHLFSV